VVTAQESVTVPVNEFDGVTEMVAVLPVVAPGLTVMVPLLVRVKLVLPPPPGACQKSPQPVRKPTSVGAAASNSNRVHFPLFIAAPSLALTGQSRSPGSDLKGNASVCVVSVRYVGAHGRS
jgi:hypothetical protein